MNVVITGIGAVTPLGLTAEASLAGVREGRSGIGMLERVIDRDDITSLDVKIGGQVRQFAPDLPPADLRRLDPQAQYAIVAGLEAAEGFTARDPERFGITSATSSGPVTLMQEATRTLDAEGPKRVLPGAVIYGGSDAAAAYLSVRLGAHGNTMGIGATCASGSVAMGEALRAIRHGYLDAVLVTASEECLTRVNLAANINIRSLTTAFRDEPHRASRPFDRDRAGFVMSSGGAAILLESAAHAAARGAEVLGELAGYGASSDAHHATAPHPEGRGAAQAMRAALRDAGLSMVDHVNAHATATPLGDTSEATALATVFGANIPPITATKSATGHLLGAAGVFEALVSLDTIRTGIIPPTLNLDHPAFPHLDIVTQPRQHTVDTAMSNSFGFGGHNAALILRRVS